MNQIVSAWQAPSDVAIRAILDGLDHVVRLIEYRWGVGRLRLLVDDGLRAKFDRQARLLDKAIESNLEADIKIQADGLKRGYIALEAAAIAAKAKFLEASVWEVTLASGEVVALVRSEAELSACEHQTVYTVAEIARLLDGLPNAVAAIKAAWPQARVERAGPMDWAKGDELPPELRA